MKLDISLPTVGTDYSGFYERFLSAPHLLIAGTTGAGKSVFVNGLIYTVMRERFPFSECMAGARFLFLDAKQCEFLRYEPTRFNWGYARETDDMVLMLENALGLCRRRQKDIMAANAEAVERGEDIDIMEYPGGDVYIVIDEFADLILRRDSHGKPLKNKVISLVQSIAQIGRSAKVHLWLCTQTPISKVLPTEIKANFSSFVVGLRTGNSNESRLIIGDKGLEDLPLHGDCVWKSPDGLEHLSGIPMVSGSDKAAVVKHWLDEATKWEPYTI